MRIYATKRAESLTKEELSIYGITTLLENAESFEKDLEKMIRNQLKNHAIYTQYLAKIQGIGPLIAAGLIAYIDDIKKFDHVSSLWQYCGYGMNRYCQNCKMPMYIEIEYETGKVAKKLASYENCWKCDSPTITIIQKKTAGYQSNWNDKLKQLAWKATKSFVMQPATKSGYRKLYDKIKSEERKKHPKQVKNGNRKNFTDGHINNRAMRKISKIFLAHLWQTWRRQLKLPEEEPYVKSLMGHNVVEAFTDK